MGTKRQKIIEPVLDLVMGLWKRSDRDFPKRAARNAFRETCYAVLRGEEVNITEPGEEVSHDSAEWARYVAASDCHGLGALLSNISESDDSMSNDYGFLGMEDSDSPADFDNNNLGIYKVKRRKMQRVNPATDRRFKTNKTRDQIEKMQKNLEQARVKANEVFEAHKGIVPETIDIPKEESHSNAIMDSADEPPQTESISTTPITEESTGIEYMEKRGKNSRPQIVPLPRLPMDYRLENEWIKNNIKSPDMLYSYVRMKAGDGIKWSSGLRKFYESNDFWEFAFDTLSCGGWHDSEHNRPICNVSKYITKVVIEEYSRHEATKHSRFEGKFESGAALLDYVKTSCSGIREELLTEEYCSWFLQKMNDCGWRWNNGATINNIPGQMSRLYDEFTEWCKNNSSSLAGLNANQYGETLRIQSAIESGAWKPRANGKFCAMDLLKIAKKK